MSAESSTSSTDPTPTPESLLGSLGNRLFEGDQQMGTESDVDSFPKKNDPSKYVNLLTQHPAVAGQAWYCASFVNPEREVKRREMFLFEKFVEQWEMTHSMKRFHDFLGFVSFKYDIPADQLFQDLDSFLATEENVFDKITVPQEFETFLDKHEEQLNTEYAAAHKFRTAIRGIKIFGTFPDEDSCRAYAKLAGDIDPRYAVVIAPTQTWQQVDARRAKEDVYGEEKLNQLFQEKAKNAAKAAEFLKQRKQDAIERNMKTNMERAAQTGNKLTQHLGEDGKLHSIIDTINFDERESAK